MAGPKKLRLIKREILNPDTCLCTFEVMSDEGLGFVGGQYIILNSGLKGPEGNDLKRAYSILSRDDEQLQLQLCIKEIPGGKVSPQFFTTSLGKEFDFSGPWGKFIKNPDWPAKGPIFLVATDTGITAVLGLINSQKFLPRLSDCSLLWFVPDENYFMNYDEVKRRLPVEFSDLQIHPLPISRDSKNHSQVRELLEKKIQQMGKPENAFLAGDGQLIMICKQLLESKGVKSDHIGIENFFNKPVESGATLQSSMSMGGNKIPEGHAVSGTTGQILPIKDMREGFTTGACAAAAAKAAARSLLNGKSLQEIESTLPNKKKVIFQLKRCEIYEDHAICSVIKDAGDDPDCTHGAELTAEVRFLHQKEILVKGGEGVATVTKAGLGLTVGHAAINPVPRKNITEMVLEELVGSSYEGAEIIISVPQGTEMAKKTLNERLGLIGGISILGTTGVVKPYSTAAYRASVVQAIALAKEQGLKEVVFTTGGKSEAYAMELFPALDRAGFIQVGDFIGTGIKTSLKYGFQNTIIVGMMGKLSKMADGVMMTHRAGSEVNLSMLAELAKGAGLADQVCQQIAQAHTARHALEICTAANFPQITSAICEKVVKSCQKHAETDMKVSCYLVDFEGALLGQYTN